MRLPPDDATFRLMELASTYIRQPTGAYLDSVTGPVVEFDPVLTSQEQATYDSLVASLDAPLTLTPTEWAAIRPHLTTIRDLRQMGRAAFMALTAAERDRLVYDAQAATTTILLAMLRD
jgi:hypothetical protein